jgi:hypothetical protein
MGSITVSDQGADTSGLTEGLTNIAKRPPSAVVRPRGALGDVDNEVGVFHASAFTQRFQRGTRGRLAPEAPHRSGFGHVPFYVDDELGCQPLPFTKNDCAAHAVESELAMDSR